jgi:hypothetical protein
VTGDVVRVARGGDPSERLHQFPRELGGSDVLADDFSILRARF